MKVRPFQKKPGFHEKNLSFFKGMQIGIPSRTQVCIHTVQGIAPVAVMSVLMNEQLLRCTKQRPLLLEQYVKAF